MDLATISAISGATVLIIGAVVSGAVRIIRELRTNKKSLDSIESLVDGRYSEVLTELSDLRKDIAEKSGLDIDKRLAAKARSKSDEQNERLAHARKGQ